MASHLLRPRKGSPGAVEGAGGRAEGGGGTMEGGGGTMEVEAPGVPASPTMPAGKHEGYRLPAHLYQERPQEPWLGPARGGQPP